MAAGFENVNRIKAAQEGGDFRRGDEVLVGEEGPEILRLGAPGRVETNRQLRTRISDLEAGAAGGGSVAVNFTGGINITIEGADLADPTNIRQIAEGLAEELQNATEEGIRLARRSADLNVANGERAV